MSNRCHRISRSANLFSPLSLHQDICLVPAFRLQCRSRKQRLHWLQVPKVLGNAKRRTYSRHASHSQQENMRIRVAQFPTPWVRCTRGPIYELARFNPDIRYGASRLPRAMADASKKTPDVLHRRSFALRVSFRTVPFPPDLVHYPPFTTLLSTSRPALADQCKVG